MQCTLKETENEHICLQYVMECIPFQTLRMSPIEDYTPKKDYIMNKRK